MLQDSILVRLPFAHAEFTETSHQRQVICYVQFQHTIQKQAGYFLIRGGGVGWGTHRQSEHWVYSQPNQRLVEGCYIKHSPNCIMLQFGPSLTTQQEYEVQAHSLALMQCKEEQNGTFWVLVATPQMQDCKENSGWQCSTSGSK